MYKMMKKMNNSRNWLVAPIVCGFLPLMMQWAVAEDIETPNVAMKRQAIADGGGGAGSRISGDLGITWTSNYAGPGARGFNLVDEGWILQPYLDLYLDVYKGDGFVNKVTLALGMWADVQENTTGATNTGGVSRWYEYDITAGVNFSLANHFTVGLTYFEITSPSDTFDNARPLYLTVSYDDTELMGAFALHPTFQYQYQLPAEGSTGMQGESSYFFFGIQPGIQVVKDGMFPTRISFPMSVGLGDNKFYNGSTFGFFAAGVQADVALKFLAEDYGNWTWSFNATYWHVGDSLAERNGRRDDVMCGTSLGLKF
jgi:hypothetical protein